MCKKEHVKDRLIKPSIGLLFIFLFPVVGSCSSSSDYQVNSSLLNSKEEITVAGSASDFKALETIISGFMKLYPGCNVKYEYLQNYNSSLLTRLKSENNTIDLFMSENIQPTGSYSTFYPYAEELYAHTDQINLTNTFSGLLKNFEYVSSETPALYAIPLGGEVRGMYVNNTLLKELGLETPKTYSELIACCQKLSENGYLPFQGNPNAFSQKLMYPYVANLIANADNYEQVYQDIDNCLPSSIEYFRQPYEEMYDIVKNGYYNYDRAENELLSYIDGSTLTEEMNFLGLFKQTDGSYKKSQNPLQRTAFLPSILSNSNNMAKIKEDYHLTLDYSFIFSPVSEEGGYAYLSPSTGIAMNKNSEHKELAAEFLNYLFTPSINTTFAEEQNIIPNTTDALNYISKSFDIPSNRISDLGKVSFSYVFYNIIKESLVNISKANKSKYMVQPEGVVMYPFSYYFDDASSTKSLAYLMAKSKAAKEGA
jgi:ABC-type glycerol-3-phosphate transport system substrate-binding protein